MQLVIDLVLLYFEQNKNFLMLYMLLVCTMVASSMTAAQMTTPQMTEFFNWSFCSLWVCKD